MKFKFLPLTGKAVWQDNKPFLWFVLSLLLIYAVLKIIFYNYNYSLLFTRTEINSSDYNSIKLIKWSLANDLLTLLLINTPLLFLLHAARFLSAKIAAWFILPLFILVNSLAVLLNLADIFYFPFHLQRAGADMFYVLNHPLKLLLHYNIFIIAFFAAAVVCLIFITRKIHNVLFAAFLNGRRAGLIALLAAVFMLFCVIFKPGITKILQPAFPLIDIRSNELPLVQNSLHTFLYSVFRKGEEVPVKNYLPAAACDSLLLLRKKLNLPDTGSGKKNIVLFIMESVPYDFFDPASPYKVAMPFFDSLLLKSTFYDNAFCYAHESNKGITAILAGIPTIPEIPVYHSQYLNMPITRLGEALKKNNYHSFFCIGDDYDNFGFAKCMNWLGIQKYYSKEDIPDYKNLPAHSMGIHDEYVLSFFRQKIKQEQQPFFAIQYNISTHYPYDIPTNFSAQLPADYTAPMKSMLYYDYSLQQFFNASKNEPWFTNTTFIFCSDHWMFPKGIKEIYNSFSGYRIPIIIYNPSVNQQKINHQTISQFDIMGTILAVAGYKDSIISYGGNLLDSSSLNNYVFSKPNSSLYQVTDSAYVLGFNITTDKPEYLYNYKNDRQLQHNLLQNNSTNAVSVSLTIRVKAFIQKAGLHYSGKLIK